MSSLYKDLSGIVLILLFTSCERVIDLKIKGDPKLVVNSLFNPDSIFAVHVSKSTDVLDHQSLSPYGQATVQLFEEGNYLENLIFGADGLYRSAGSRPVGGRNYTIKVSDSELGTAEATDTVTFDKVEIESVEFVNELNAKYEYPITIKFKDPAGVRNFYVVKVYEVAESGAIYEADLRSDDITASFNSPASDGISFSDQLIDGKEYTFKMNVFLPFEKIIVELRNVSNAYYNYHHTQHLQINKPTDPFTTPTEIFNNISNGLGIFAGYQKDTMVVTPVE